MRPVAVLAHLARLERLDHAVFLRHAADPLVGFDGHVSCVRPALVNYWIPACAGMTIFSRESLRRMRDQAKTGEEAECMDEYMSIPGRFSTPYRAV